jgi:hypothetical protein
MAVGEAYGFCEHCRSPTRFVRNTPNHCLHFLLSTVTLGLWSIVWLLCVLRAPIWRCVRCRRKTARPQPGGSGAPPDLSPRAAAHAERHAVGGDSFSLKLIGSGLVFYVPTGATFRLDPTTPASPGFV